VVLPKSKEGLLEAPKVGAIVDPNARVVVPNVSVEIDSNAGVVVAPKAGLLVTQNGLLDPNIVKSDIIQHQGFVQQAAIK
jgi:hypothetical protein